MGSGIAKRWLSAGFLLALFCGACDRNSTSEPAITPPSSEDGDAAQDVNLDVWLERLEVGSRELYSARDAVVAAIDLKPGDKIADIGAGTGLYSLLFAEQVGETGAVYAVDIEPLFLDLINRRAADDGLTNVTSVLNRLDSVTLPHESVDAVFIADTYHYFEDREAIMTTVLSSLKPGGKLVIVDFEITPGEPRPEGKEYVKFGKSAVISEIEFVGFEHVTDIEVPGLDDNYLSVFRKPAE